MSSVSETISEHTTIGDIRRRYGIKTVGTQHDAVTLTSVADALEDITPGALYISSTSEYDSRIVHAAARRGAYAVVFMLEDKAQSQIAPIDMEIPVLFADMHNDERARIAADLAGEPSRSLAVFAVQGDSLSWDTEEIDHADGVSDNDSDSDTNISADITVPDTEATPRVRSSVITELYDLLHYLGNPLGIIDRRGGISLERELSLPTPLSPLDIQRMLYVMVEDGATSVIIDVDDEVLQSLALTKVNVDVYTNTVNETYNVPQIGPQHTFLTRKSKHDEVEDLRRLARQNIQPYGAEIRDNTMCVEATDDSRELVREVLGEINERQYENIATAVAMVLAAGVKRNSVKSALRLSYEMKADKS
ncbi:hypothetical protein EJ419_05945 [Alloscardovia theropitheci]|uniref:UDP-N-acetylmuramyl peptide synthase n=1 Tax=Alloscardovia theropitheci TaxID=2496842 RepID=A0A4R0QWS7_9BIFI|nr:hypothetical protein [Alloscardovia theropitheci]TCD53970.1 hypothetical protein EJ419_05945 [Alloscardovia theropitheci]